MAEYEEQLKRFRKWLPAEPNDLSDLVSLGAFCSLFTARCLDSLYDGRQMLYRRRAGTTLFELRPAERILLECAGHLSSLPALVSAAAKKIRQAMPDTQRALTPADEGKFAEIQAGLAEALAYQPPVSSCSV